MTDHGLSTQQLAVICALSSGATMIAAAQEAGVHRNTLGNWCRNNLPFQQAFAHAQYHRALYFREKIEERIDLAFKTLDDLLGDPGTPPSVRLKAALAIITTASTPPEPKKQVELDIEKIVVKPNPTTVTEDQLAPADPRLGLPPVGETRQICTTCRLIVNDGSADRCCASLESDGEAEASSAGEQLAKE